MISQTGYQIDTQGSWISKDPTAQLTYNMLWSDWLTEGENYTST